MIDSEKVGVGIITCNRRESYIRLLNAVKSAEDVDFIVTVKNLTYDYQEDDPSIVCNNKNSEQLLTSIEIPEKSCIAHNKNEALKSLLGNGAQHIFLVEDDILIKDKNVFSEYIHTAKEFHIEHLNFCRSFDALITHQFLTPSLTIAGKKYKLDIFQRLCGNFSYFTRNSILKAGLFDEEYKNVLDHCEHTYRMSLLGFYTPFYSFADIYQSTRFIEDTGIQTTIQHSPEYDANVNNAVIRFAQTYGYRMADIPVPQKDQILKFLTAKSLSKNKT